MADRKRAVDETRASRKNMRKEKQAEMTKRVVINETVELTKRGIGTLRRHEFLLNLNVNCRSLSRIMSQNGHSDQNHYLKLRNGA